MIISKQLPEPQSQIKKANKNTTYVIDHQHLQRIACSNKSRIYQEVDNQKNLTGNVYKLILHGQKGSHQEQCQHLSNEFNLLSEIKHSHIITLKSQFYQNCIYKGQECCCIVLDQAECDFFNLIKSVFPNYLNIKLIKKWFMQLALAIEYLHNIKNITHNDIKLENLMIKDNNLLLVDFGFARKGLPQNKQDQQAKWNQRSQQYLAPEVQEQIKNYQKGKPTLIFDEKKSDIFSLGVTLFSAIFIKPPFETESHNKSDPLYGNFYKKTFEEFWQEQQFTEILDFIEKNFENSQTEELKDLLQKNAQS